jgi:hypothetical protein
LVAALIVGSVAVTLIMALSRYLNHG